jgi:TfoX N-terminal domain
MFGGIAFLIGGNMALAVSSHGGLLVRVDPAEVDALVAAGARQTEMRGRMMTGWLRVDPADDEVEAWVERGAAVARSLPPKG